eukprot:CAMPEP_0180317224 /NCGR_PEP_ID=MMETSP0988-20121125/33717_1 /TAXON_ID=697907 /ORGANISM="non described non described, Strain CCMP2293" /LENGTH=110 /DNA_ID=CAMNT_0022302453 /DNA_START=61 /DNA_END=393 /DNA_ORIENTATION=-
MACSNHGLPPKFLKEILECCGQQGEKSVVVARPCRRGHEGRALNIPVPDSSRCRSLSLGRCCDRGGGAAWTESAAGAALARIGPIASHGPIRQARAGGRRRPPLSSDTSN